MSRAALLYDRDCGFCRAVSGVVLALDRRRALRPVSLQDPEAAMLLPELTQEQRMDSFHLVEPDGTVHSAGEALAALMAHLPGGGPLARAGFGRPRATERVYRLVADHRDQLGPLIPDGAKRWATRLIDRR